MRVGGGKSTDLSVSQGDGWITLLELPRGSINMKTIKTFASASVLAMAATGAHAAPVSVDTFANIILLPGATLVGTGTGDLTGGVLTYALTQTTNLGLYGTAVVEMTGTWTDGNPGAGTTNILSCTGAAIACGQISIGDQGPSASVGPLSMSETDVTVFTVAGDNTIGDMTWTITPSAVPVPAAAWLFGSAILGLVGVGRRKSKA